MKFELTGYGGNIYSNKNHGTQVSPLTESKMAAKTQNCDRQCKILFISPDLRTTKLIFMSKCMLKKT